WRSPAWSLRRWSRLLPLLSFADLGCWPCQRDADGLTDAQVLGGCGAGFDQEHELRALVQAIDYRRRELGAAGDEADLGRDAALAAIAADIDRVAQPDLGQHRLVDEEAYLQVAGRQDGDDRLARGHQLAAAGVDLLDGAGDRAEPFTPGEPRLRGIEPRLRSAQRRLGVVQGLLGPRLGLRQLHGAVIGLLRVLDRGLLHGDVGELQVGIEGEQRLLQYDLVAF